MKRSHQIINAMRFHRQLKTFCLPQTNRSLLLNTGYPAVDHVSSYNLFPTTNQFCSPGCTKKVTGSERSRGICSSADLSRKCFSNPPQNRHPERSASQIYRIME